MHLGLVRTTAPLASFNWEVELTKKQKRFGMNMSGWFYQQHISPEDAVEKREG